VEYYYLPVKRNCHAIKKKKNTKHGGNVKDILLSERSRSVILTTQEAETRRIIV
jgi:hypothetical protein